MKTLPYIFLLWAGCAVSAFSQNETSTRNIILVTLDGLRWQEVFTGANKKLVKDKDYVENPQELKNKYWNDDPDERRKILMPFMWSTIATEGQIYGNRKYQNCVNLTNRYWFSYPGYNEILTGIRNDKTIYSNKKRNNPNVTILEYLNSLPAYHNQVAAVSSWDLFPYILNVKRSGLFVNAGNQIITKDPLTDEEKELNSIEEEVTSPKADRPDVLTYLYAMEYLKKYTPKMMFISYGETDDLAHAGRYDEYLDAIHHIDHYIEELWNFIQSNDQYRNKTTLIITTDHGRGCLFRNSWMNHGSLTPGSGQTWFAVMGPDTSPKGEIKTAGQLYQNQLARTMAAFLNVNFDLYKKEGAVVSQVIQKGMHPNEKLANRIVNLPDKQ
ncbi:MAG TPA: alkaline phosphatase family protein [Bacteroidales bacterium]